METDERWQQRSRVKPLAFTLVGVLAFCIALAAVTAPSIATDTAGSGSGSGNGNARARALLDTHLTAVCKSLRKPACRQALYVSSVRADWHGIDAYHATYKLEMYNEAWTGKDNEPYTLYNTTLYTAWYRASDGEFLEEG